MHQCIARINYPSTGAARCNSKHTSVSDWARSSKKSSILMQSPTTKNGDAEREDALVGSKRKRSVVEVKCEVQSSSRTRQRFSKRRVSESPKIYPSFPVVKYTSTRSKQTTQIIQQTKNFCMNSVSSDRLKFHITGRPAMSGVFNSHNFKWQEKSNVSHPRRRTGGRSSGKGSSHAHDDESELQEIAALLLDLQSLKSPDELEESGKKHPRSECRETDERISQRGRRQQTRQRSPENSGASSIGSDSKCRKVAQTARPQVPLFDGVDGARTDVKGTSISDNRHDSLSPKPDQGDALAHLANVANRHQASNEAPKVIGPVQTNLYQWSDATKCRSEGSMDITAALSGVPLSAQASLKSTIQQQPASHVASTTNVSQAKLVASNPVAVGRMQSAQSQVTGVDGKLGTFTAGRSPSVQHAAGSVPAKSSGVNNVALKTGPVQNVTSGVPQHYPSPSANPAAAPSTAGRPQLIQSQQSKVAVPVGKIAAAQGQVSSPSMQSQRPTAAHNVSVESKGAVAGATVSNTGRLSGVQSISSPQANAVGGRGLVLNSASQALNGVSAGVDSKGVTASGVGGSVHRVNQPPNVTGPPRVAITSGIAVQRVQGSATPMQPQLAPLVKATAGVGVSMNAAQTSPSIQSPRMATAPSVGNDAKIGLNQGRVQVMLSPQSQQVQGAAATLGCAKVPITVMVGKDDKGNEKPQLPNPPRIVQTPPSTANPLQRERELSSAGTPEHKSVDPTKTSQISSTESKTLVHPPNTTQAQGNLSKGQTEVSPSGATANQTPQGPATKPSIQGMPTQVSKVMGSPQTSAPSNSKGQCQASQPYPISRTPLQTAGRVAPTFSVGTVGAHGTLSKTQPGQGGPAKPAVVGSPARPGLVTNSPGAQCAAVGSVKSFPATSTASISAAPAAQAGPAPPGQSKSVAPTALVAATPSPLARVQAAPVLSQAAPAGQAVPAPPGQGQALRQAALVPKQGAPVVGQTAPILSQAAASPRQGVTAPRQAAPTTGGHQIMAPGQLAAPKQMMLVPGQPVPVGQSSSQATQSGGGAILAGKLQSSQPPPPAVQVVPAAAGQSISVAARQANPAAVALHATSGANTTGVAKVGSTAVRPIVASPTGRVAVTGAGHATTAVGHGQAAAAVQVSTISAKQAIAAASAAAAAAAAGLPAAARQAAAVAAAVEAGRAAAAVGTPAVRVVSAVPHTTISTAPITTTVEATKALAASSAATTQIAAKVPTSSNTIPGQSRPTVGQESSSSAVATGGGGTAMATPENAGSPNVGSGEAAPKATVPA